jgi:hypothetical protein
VPGFEGDLMSACFTDTAASRAASFSASSAVVRARSSETCGVSRMLLLCERKAYTR